MGLFSINIDRPAALLASAFSQQHAEADMQRWADLCPALINDNQPMLSLGREIVTTHELYIDNLYLDGNGVLVAAEMKRGKTPRDVVAQILEYASFVSGLEWEQVEALCLKRHKKPLDVAFAELFGRPLTRQPKPAYRLLIVAESYDPRVVDSALYMINSGGPLALIRFAYYRVGDRDIIETATVLGEIPEQSAPHAITAVAARSIDTAADQGYSTWLLSTLRDRLMEVAAERGWNLQIRLNKQTLPFGDTVWPLSLGDCQLRVDTYKGGSASLRLSFRKDAAPGLVAFLEQHREHWEEAFAGKLEQPSYPTPNACFTLDLPRPEVGDEAAVTALFERLDAMSTAFLPLLSKFFTMAPAPANTGAQ